MRERTRLVLALIAALLLGVAIAAVPSCYADWRFVRESRLNYDAQMRVLAAQQQQQQHAQPAQPPTESPPKK